MQDKTGKSKEDKADLAQAVKARDLLMLRDTVCNNIQTYNKNLLAGWRTCRGLVPQNLMNTWLLYAVQLKVVEESQCALDAMVWFSNLIRKKKHVTTNDFCSRWITLISMLTAKWTWTQRWVRVHWGFKVQTTLICCSFLKIHWNGAGPYPLTTAISRTFCKASSERGPHPDEVEAWMYMHEFIENRGSKTIHEPWKFIDNCCVPSIENRTSKKTTRCLPDSALSSCASWSTRAQGGVQGWVRGCVQGCVQGWVQGWVYRWVQGGVQGCVRSWVQGWVQGCVRSWAQGWAQRCVQGCVQGWVQGWVQGRVQGCVQDWAPTGLA